MRFIILIALFISIDAFGQWKDYIISVKGDTLNRVDMNDKKQGPWVIHMDDLRGEQGYDEQGYFVDDKKDGKWVRFSLMGDKLAEENYRWGNLNGKSRYYTRRGGLMREETWRAIEPGRSFDTVDVVDPSDPAKVIDQVIVKVEGQTMKHGTWTYFDPEWGTITKTEDYWIDKLRTDKDTTLVAGTDGDDEEDIKPVEFSGTKPKPNANSKSLTKPQVILDYEKKNSGKKKVRVRDGSTGQ